MFVEANYLFTGNTNFFMKNTEYRMYIDQLYVAIVSQRNFYNILKRLLV